MITNKYNLPDAIYRAIKADPYHKGESDFSVTELIQPARIRALTIKYRAEIEEDASDRIWSLLGQAVHSILERSNDSKKAISEKRYFAKFGKYVVSAQIDSLDLDGGILSDYKVTSSWGFMANREPKPEWVQQLNMQLEILRRNSLDAKVLQIVGLLRDWQKREAKSSRDYPNFQVALLPIPVWSREETVEFIERRIQAHLSAEVNLPFCSSEERWASPDRFAIIRGTNKRAVRVVESLTEAQDYVHNLGSGHRIEVRRGENRRCGGYCPVSSHCDWYQKINRVVGVEHDTREKDVSRDDKEV